MLVLVDTNIAIHLRDLDRSITSRLAAVEGPLAMSVLTVAELEGGVHRDPKTMIARQEGLERLLGTIQLIDCDRAVTRAYGRIVAALGFSRVRMLDRLIAATAIVHDLTLVTINGEDFHDIPGLALEVWPAPGQ